MLDLYSMCEYKYMIDVASKQQSFEFNCMKINHGLILQANNNLSDSIV